MSEIDTAHIEAGEQHDVIAEFPCTQTQMRCWFLDQLSPGNPALNVAVRWKIRGAFRTASIEAAFRKVIERHEILRTRFLDVDGEPIQQVVGKVDFKMSVIDLRHVPAEQLDERIQSISKETASAPFDLGVPGLFRVTFLMVENERGFILITAHQTCFDGWSIRVLGREVGELASAIDAQRAPKLPDLPLQYGDFAMWQSEYRKSYGFEAEKAYWREQLASAPYFEILPDRPRGRVKTSRGEILSRAMPIEFGERIDAAARTHHVSLFSYGAAVVSAALHRYTGAREVLFGTQIAGREEVDLENLIGVFINNLVLRFDISNDQSFVSHLQRVSETVTDALNHQKMPFNNLVELVNPARDPSRNPLVSVNFNQQKAFLENVRYDGFELISAPSQSPGVIYDLNFIMIGRPDGWRMSVEYNTDLFDARTAQELLDLWKATYDFALNDATAEIGALSTPTRSPVIRQDVSPAPPQIETLLMDHRDVAEAMVLHDEARTYALVKPAPDLAGPIEALPERLTAYLSEHLGQNDMPDGISVVVALSKNGGEGAGQPAEHNGAPRTEILSPSDREARLGAIWANVLGRDRVEGEDDFFALGGHSLLALRMLSAMREAFGTKPDLTLLFKEPTLAGFTRAVFGEAEEVGADKEAAIRTPCWETSLYRKGDGDCTVYTLNHPFLYYRMAQLLPEDASVVNLHMFNARIDDALRKRSFEQIAGEAIAAMDLGEKPNAIAIVGLCVNGILAAEMARQLRHLGHDIRFVALIDSWAPGYVRSLSRFKRWRWNTEKRLKRVRYFTFKLLGGRISLINYLKEFNLTLKLVGRLSASGSMNDEEQANAEVTEFLVDAARRYRPRSIAGEAVLLFRSQANHKRSKALLFGWRGFVPDDTPVFDLTGWHEDSLTSAGIGKLSALLSEHLKLGGRAAQ